jgi:hypothetical protein
VGGIVWLDGSGSYDENNYQLTYNWSIVSKPEGSTAEIYMPQTVQPGFTPDAEGEYVIGLVVNNGIVDSDISTVTILATYTEEMVISTLKNAVSIIRSLPHSVFRNRRMQKILIMRIQVITYFVSKKHYKITKLQLEYGMLRKLNGCAERGFPDTNDWIRDCDAQGQVYPVILEAIDLLDILCSY